MWGTERREKGKNWRRKLYADLKRVARSSTCERQPLNSEIVQFQFNSKDKTCRGKPTGWRSNKELIGQNRIRTRRTQKTGKKKKLVPSLFSNDDRWSLPPTATGGEHCWMLYLAKTHLKPDEISFGNPSISVPSSINYDCNNAPPQKQSENLVKSNT